MWICVFNKLFIDKELFHTVSNHPPHIFGNGRLSPSAFIPFCSFGEDLDSMGIKIKQFKHPVCNSFHPIIRNDQLCYQVDLNRFRNEDKLDDQLKKGLVLLLDFNEDRQLKLDSQLISNQEKSVFTSDAENSAQIHLETISEIRKNNNLYFTNFFADSVTLSGKGQFNLNILKEISGTDSYLGLDQNVRGCQNDEPYDNCTTRHYIEAMRDKCGCLPFPVTIPGNEVYRLILLLVLFHVRIMCKY